MVMKKNNRAKGIFGTKDKPRLTVFKGTKNIYAQIIDDELGNTLVSASSLSPEVKQKSTNLNVQTAGAVGKLLGEKAVSKGITTVVFDRRNKRYHGRVKAVAEGAREVGLTF